MALRISSGENWCYPYYGFTTIRTVENRQDKNCKNWLGEKHAELLNSIVGIREMIRGSFGTVYRKCGKLNCWCAKGAGHPSDRIVFSQGSRSKSKAVAKKEVRWVKRMTENRRKFGKYRQQLRAVVREIQDEIDKLEA